MKTTIDIPEPLYRKAKIQAIEQGSTLKELVLRALTRELESSTTPTESAPYFARRKLRPGFRALSEAGVLQGGTDATELIAEERNDR
jgi:hypothetical protein